jgi:hypothetical protein
LAAHPGMNGRHDEPHAKGREPPVRERPRPVSRCIALFLGCGITAAAGVLFACYGSGAASCWRPSSSTWRRTLWARWRLPRRTVSGEGQPRIRPRVRRAAGPPPPAGPSQSDSASVARRATDASERTEPHCDRPWGFGCVSERRLDTYAHDWTLEAARPGPRKQSSLKSTAGDTSGCSRPRW